MISGGVPGDRGRRRPLASLVLLFLATELVLRPIRHVVAMAQKVIGGDLSARVGIRPPGEMGVLCRAVDSMAQAVAEREELLKQATRQQIGRSEQLASVGRLAAGVAHEINNPLTGVLAFADLLREKENMDDQDREDLDLIIRETKRAREIVRGLLDFARETPSVKTHLNINDVVRQTMRLLGKREASRTSTSSRTWPRPAAGPRRQEPAAAGAGEPVAQRLRGHAQRRHAHGRPRRCDDDRVVVKVTDTGCGIKQEHLDKIFEPFFTTKPVGKGTGLGLSVSYGIVQQHGGTLEVESEEGKGTHLHDHACRPCRPAASSLRSGSQRGRLCRGRSSSLPTMPQSVGAAQQTLCAGRSTTSSACDDPAAAVRAAAARRFRRGPGRPDRPRTRPAGRPPPGSRRPSRGRGRDRAQPQTDASKPPWRR